MNEETNVPVNTKVLHPVHRVTVISKYLALALFIALPFLGVYVGYQFAPIEVLEVERVVYRDAIEVSPVWEVPTIDETAVIKERFKEFAPVPGLDITLLYQDVDSPLAYYTTFYAATSRCCGIVAYDTELKSFSTTSYAIDVVFGEKATLDGRYIVRVDTPTSTDTSLSVIDLEIPAVVKTITPRLDESFQSGGCGYAGSTFDIAWVATSTLRYGVYAEETVDEWGCKKRFIEYKEETL